MTLFNAVLKGQLWKSTDEGQQVQRPAVCETVGQVSIQMLLPSSFVVSL